MKFSLLQKTGDAYAHCGVLYDISADRAVHRMVPDRRRADYFLSVLEKPLTKRENILFRQEIYRDLREIEGLLPALQLLFARYDRIRSDWQEMRLSAVSSHGQEVNPEALLEYTFASLKITAIFPQTIFSFFHSIGETLDGYPIRSEGLTAIRDWCRQMARNEALDEIVRISQLFRYQTPDYFDFTLAAKLDASLRLVSCDISGIAPHKNEEGMLGRLFGKKKQESDFTPVTAELSKAGEDPYSDSLFMLNGALSRIDRALTGVTNDVYEAFFGLSREIMFYEAAMCYADKAEESGISPVLPEILPMEADTLSAEGLKELVLLANGDGEKTVANDIDLAGENAGYLVKGLTDSGKTVFLRAVAGAQLFAQAGLPVLARRASFSVRQGFFSHFSCAEEEFLSGDAAGRFDQEAKEISDIIGELRPYSLLLLNETFQTTSYREGTESIYNILRFMPKLKTKYIFVTHLTGLFGYMEKEKVILAHTSEDPKDRYRIIR